MTTTPQPSQASQSTATKPATNRELPLPQSDRDPAHLQGHWLLAGIGKRVLRILRNVLGNKDIRARVLNMKHTFDKYRNELTGSAFVVRKPEA